MTDQPIAPLTADERALLRDSHKPYAYRGQAHCAVDGDVWPCVRSRLLATVDAAEQRATHAEAARDAARNLGALTAMKLAQQLEAGADDEAALAAERAARERAERWAALWKRKATGEWLSHRAVNREFLRAVTRNAKVARERDALAREVGALRKALEKSDAGARSCGRVDCLHFDCYAARRRARRGRGVIAPGWRDAGGEAGS